jgi:amidohydrolase
MREKKAVEKRIDAIRSDLVDLSHRIHSKPEIGYEEENASYWIGEILDSNGFSVQRGACDLPTALIGKYGSGPLHIGICAEYDALPVIGHACGHNVIAASSVGAALSLAEIADDIGLTVSLIGTPAEETLRCGGKIVMLERGAFSGIHAAMMVHPGPADRAEWPIIAATFFDVTYRGVASHASGFPELGINAADALTIAQTSIGLLRQHLRSTDRVHGIVTKGGDAFNIIPALARAEYGVRALTLNDLDSVYEKVVRCFEAGAIATGATLEVDGGDRPYAHMEHDRDIARLYQQNAEALGRKFPGPGETGITAAVSTDMGNVSLVIPSIHPSIDIGALPAVNHQPEFAAHCITESADQAIYDGALSMAWTGIDMAVTPSIRDRLLALGG